MKLLSLKAIYFFAFLFAAGGLYAQTPHVELLASGTKTSLRGLSVVNDNVLWVSGSNGTVGKSTNAGKTWKWVVVKGFEKTDFRDIEAFDASTAIIMGISTPAYILKTTDGGETWKVVYENKTKGMFLDAIDFANSQQGIVVGDPLNNNIFMAETEDGGDTWQELKDKRAVADSGEAFFAASGTNIRLFANKDFSLVSGGKRSRIYTRFAVNDLPIIQGKESTGANSIAIYDKGKQKRSKRMAVVGGDFSADSSTEKNFFITKDGGKTWKTPRTSPHGYRSCIEFLSKDDLICCGLNGVDYSYDSGRNWKWISKEGFNACRIARIGTAIFLAGGNGKVGKVVWK